MLFSCRKNLLLARCVWCLFAGRCEKWAAAQQWGRQSEFWVRNVGFTGTGVYRSAFQGSSDTLGSQGKEPPTSILPWYKHFSSPGNLMVDKRCLVGKNWAVHLAGGVWSWTRTLSVSRCYFRAFTGISSIWLWANIKGFSEEGGSGGILCAINTTGQWAVLVLETAGSNVTHRKFVYLMPRV